MTWAPGAPLHPMRAAKALRMYSRGVWEVARANVMGRRSSVTMNWLRDPKVLTTKTSSSSALNALSLSTDATQKQPTDSTYFAAERMRTVEPSAAPPTLSCGHVHMRLPSIVTPAPTICRGVKRLPRMKDESRIVHAKLD